MNSEKAYEFINSTDIREYLKKQDYQLNPVECAFLVWQSKRHTLTEKHEAWNDIIDTLPDCAVEERCNCAGWDSLHAMLRGYMALEEKIMTIFQADENASFYEYELWENVSGNPMSGNSGYSWNGGFRHFLSFEACYRHAIKDAGEANCRFRVRKRYIDSSPTASDDDPAIIVEYDNEGNVMKANIEQESEFFRLSDEEHDLYCTSFTGMWFDIPIPFKKGDIVCDNASIHSAGIPFVLMGTDPWYRKEYAEQDTYCTDYSDMNAYGYSYDHRQRFYFDDYMVDYLNLEQYTQPLCGPERLLYAYSEFVKGEIDGYTLLKLYQMIQAEATVENEREELGSYLNRRIWKNYTIGSM